MVNVLTLFKNSFDNFFSKSILYKKTKNTILILPLTGCCFLPAALAEPVVFDGTAQNIDDNAGADLVEAISVVTADIDDDGDEDVIAIAETGDRLVFYENVDGDGDTWTPHIIDGALNGPTQLRLVNMDDDDELEIIVSAVGSLALTDDFIYLYNIPDTDPTDVPWDRSVITDFAGRRARPNAIAILDIDGDTDLDVAAALFNTHEVTWYENPEINPPAIPSSFWEEHIIFDRSNDSTLTNPRYVLAVNIDNDGNADLLSASFHSNGTTGHITWHETTDNGATWAQHFDISKKRAVALVAEDMNDDGRPDIVAALRFDNTVAIFEQPASAPDANSWNEVTVSTVVQQARSVALGDIDNDCDLDIVSAAYGMASPEGDESQILWHDNPRIGVNTAWDTYIIDQDNLRGAATVAVTDIDDDGTEGVCGVAELDLDVVTAMFKDNDVNWYRNQRVHGVRITDVGNQPLTEALTVTESNVPAGSNQETFQVELSTQPEAASTVTIPIVVPANGEVTLDKTSLNFTDVNWDTPQTVTVTAVDDAIDDDNQTFNITFGVITSDDEDYDGVVPGNFIVVTTIDDENPAPGINVSPISGPTSEIGTKATFAVALNSEPTGNVMIAVASSNTDEGVVNKTSLTFNSTNWFQAQTVTVTGQDDDIDDGNVDYSIILGPVTGGDATYNAINPGDVAVVNNDDGDTAGISVSTISGPTAENGTTATFTVVLDSEPVANILLDVESLDESEGVANPAQLTFTPGNWNDSQTVTVTGQPDNEVDGNVNYTIQVSIANANGDGKYNGLTAVTVAVTNTDVPNNTDEVIFDSGSFEGN